MNMKQSNFFCAALVLTVACGGAFAQTITSPGFNLDLGSGWRTSTVPKLDIDGNNVLGTDGYYVPFGNGAGLVGDLKVPVYVTGEAIAGTASEYSGNGGYYSIDNPLVVPPGTGLIQTGNLNETSNGPLFQFTLTGTVPYIIRVGVMVDNQDGNMGQFNGASVTLDCTSCAPVIDGPVVTTTSIGTPSFNDRIPDWIFFDITNGVAGQTYEIVETVGINPNQSANKAALGAISFDSLAMSPTAYKVGFAGNLNAGDSFVNLSNDGTQGGFDPNPAASLCANVYVFDPEEEEIACCSCLVTPDGLNALSAKSDLINNTLTSSIPGSIVIKLVSSTPTSSTTGALTVCNPAATLIPAGGLLAWGTTLEPAGTAGTYGVVNVPFINGNLSPSELTSLTEVCAFNQSNGSGFAICGSCTLGALGGAKK